MDWTVDMWKVNRCPAYTIVRRGCIQFMVGIATLMLWCTEPTHLTGQRILIGSVRTRQGTADCFRTKEEAKAPVPPHLPLGRGLLGLLLAVAATR